MHNNRGNASNTSNISFKHTGFEPTRLALEESLFSLGNGYLGVRASLEECEHVEGSIRGSYINGLYEKVPMQHAEMAFGFPVEQDKQPRIVDTQTVRIFLDEEQVVLDGARISDFSRELDLETGIYTRNYGYTTKSGAVAQLTFWRIASLTAPQHFCYKLQVQYEGVIRLESVLRADVENYTNPDDPRVSGAHAKLLVVNVVDAIGALAFSEVQTKTSNLRMAVAVNHVATCDWGQIPVVGAAFGEHVIHTVGAVGMLTLEKHCAFSDTLRHEAPLNDAKEKALAYNFMQITGQQKLYLSDFWALYGIQITGSDQDALALKWMQFQLLQALGRDAYANMAAKGLSGEGYEGHYFWDTEIYAIPVAVWMMPERAKALLNYRFRLLPFAKQRALELGHQRGAAYPWRTISGTESSGYFPAGTAQYHINADIAYAAVQYHLAHGDWEWMRLSLFEMLYETGLIWLEIGHRHEQTFRICAVTGPDEYTAIVNNNYYTNTMAKYHMTWVVRLHGELTARYGALFSERWGDQGHIAAIADMAWAADSMWLPVDTVQQIACQDDAFMTKPLWPFKNPQYQKRPLLLHYHPLTIYRHQVLKQADTVLAHLLVDDFIDDQLMANTYDYYEPLTTHDSSLSACIYGMMAARLNCVESAYAFFQQTLNLDVNDTHGNAKDGLHLANIAGAVLSIYKGFTGMRMSEGQLRLRPVLPMAWQGYQFGIAWQSGHLRVTVARNNEVLETALEWTSARSEVVHIEVFGKESTTHVQLSKFEPFWKGCI